MFEFRRSLDIGKQRRDRFALAFEILGSGYLSDANAADVGLADRGGRSRSKRRAAFAAEFCGEDVFEATRGTLCFEGRAALGAELETVSVFGVAFRTAHRSRTVGCHGILYHRPGFFDTPSQSL